MSSLNILDDTRALLVPALRKTIDGLSEPERLVASYHLGFVDDIGNPVAQNGGKYLRPTLTLLGARAAGIDPASAVPAAVAVELIHNFSLVHDDIMDRDHARRHRPTVWALWGEATAILTGDALHALAFETVTQNRGPGALPGSHLLARTIRELVRGQVLDMQFERQSEVSFTQCRDMAAAKTRAVDRL